jgi:hypothetical protein
MKILVSLVLVSTLLCLASVTSAQKRATRKPQPSSGSVHPICQGEAVPRGLVVVGLKPSTRCGSSPELVTKKPSDSEVVCESSPVPPGYSVTSVTSSPACASASSNPLTNAVVIARDGAIAGQCNVPPKASPTYYSDDEEEANSPRRQGRPSRQSDDTQRLVEERADEANQRAREHLAQKEWEEKVEQAVGSHQLLIGMTTEQVLRSWGRPGHIDTFTNARGTSSTWFYNRAGRGVLLSFDEDGILQYAGSY